MTTTATRTFRLPDLGEGLPGAEIVRWLAEPGEAIAVDQPVVEVETAKAQVELPSPYAGTLSARFGAPGEEVPVGAPLFEITEPGGPAAPGNQDGPAADGEGPGRVLVGYGTAAPPRRRGTEKEPEAAPRFPAPAPTREAPATPSREEPGTGPLPPANPPVVSPLVRRLARELDVDVRTVAGSGPGGLVLRADVHRAARAARCTRVPLRGVAAAMAEAMTRSQAEIPAATCWVEADATDFLAARRHTGLPLLALLARVCLDALGHHPELNASLDAGAREIVRHHAVHLGFAASTERGLLVPVVSDAQKLTTVRLAAELTRLTEAARAGTLPPAALTGATFTLNNYGVFGVDGGSPLLRPPEAAMLGVGRIAERPWVHQGALAPRQVVRLSLTFDHRVCDGAAAGGFLRRAADLVERPLLLVRER